MTTSAEIKARIAARLWQSVALAGRHQQAASGALAVCEAWLKDGGRPGGTVLQDYDGPEPKLLKGENVLLDAIEKRRRRIRDDADTDRRRRVEPLRRSVVHRRPLPLAPLGRLPGLRGLPVGSAA
jgi:hypothetical protein